MTSMYFWNKASLNKAIERRKRMEWVSNWIQGIIIAVIISTIIEMVLPEGNCKKYIKVVIGVYILFSIISPVINKVTGNNLKLADIFDLDEYIEASTSNTYQNVNDAQERQIKEIYQNSLKNDMKEKIQTKGYKVINIFVDIEDNEQYSINEINLRLEKQEEQEKVKKESSKIQEVNKVTIQIGESCDNEEVEQLEEGKKEKLSILEKRELKQYLGNIYEIAEEKININ